MDTSHMMDKLGKYLTPRLCIILVAIPAKGVSSSIGSPVDTEIENSFSNSFKSFFKPLIFSTFTLLTIR
jgi:branched-subunit amino acid permease